MARTCPLMTHSGHLLSKAMLGRARSSNTTSPRKVCRAAKIVSSSLRARRTLRVRMKIDCLMGTYGRYGLVCEALACFLQQSRLSQATLLIYNQHPVFLRFDHPRVRVVNEAAPRGSLRHIRQRMHELAEPSAELIHWWDDDDLYLPWHLDDCLTHIKESMAWKPATSWMSLRNVKFSRHANRFEGSWVMRAEYVRRHPLETHPDYTDHPVVRQTEDAGLLATTELGGEHLTFIDGTMELLTSAADSPVEMSTIRRKTWNSGDCGAAMWVSTDGWCPPT